MGVGAFANGSPHLSPLGRAKRMTLRRGGHVKFQHELALRKANVPAFNCFDFHALIGGQSKFSPLIQYCADAAGEAQGTKGNVSNGEHNGAWLGKGVAVHPKIIFWKGDSAILFNIANAAIKAVGFAVNP